MEIFPTFQLRFTLLRTLSLRDLLVSEDALLTNHFYSCLYEAPDSSIHEKVPAFNKTRNGKMRNNLEHLAHRNKHRTIVFVTGDDHYVYLKDQIIHNKIY